ncbi:uridine phosphorylase 2 [Leopardus geoffroyi]|uniref:uridine phosphorylase 2 n=1 Tax=Leopardus geoffroyi TaxID=46844 RepID=UPI001E260302|nr:uridine phosphorylase 2 [Leopardus geoffroyi]
MRMLHELIKLLHHAQCCDVTVIRTGTLGRIGQGLLDGALWSFSREEKFHCLKRAHKAGIRNTDTESAVSLATRRNCDLKEHEQGRVRDREGQPSLVWVLRCMGESVPHLAVFAYSLYEDFPGSPF